ncbi:MAG: DUF4167 domain-containing protein [Pseudomonadota bacterium]
MRQGNNSRRLRGRPNRKQHISPRAQIYDSHGPDVRIRGNAPQVYEKYLALARDATAAGNRVGAESYFQFAEHYFRIMNDTTDPQRAAPASDAQRANTDENRGRPNRPYGGDEQPHVDWPESGSGNAGNAGNGHDRNPAERRSESGESARPSGDQRGSEGRGRREPRGGRPSNRDPELPLDAERRPAAETAQAEPKAEATPPEPVKAEPEAEVESPVALPPAIPIDPPEEEKAEAAPAPRRGRPKTKRAAGTGTTRKTATKATRKKKAAPEESSETDGDKGETEEVSA